MGKFADGVRQFRLKVEGQALANTKQVILGLDTKIVLRTPVDTGRARGNWLPSIGQAPEIGETGLLGDASVQEILGRIGDLKIGDTFWISNNVEYIAVLEYGLYPNPPKHPTGKTVGGFSTQAPAGFVRISVQEFSAIAAELPTAD